MDFDHRPGTIKVADVSVLARSSTKERTLDEIAKCDLVCANCHRIRTERVHEAKRSSQRPKYTDPVPASQRRAKLTVDLVQEVRGRLEYGEAATSIAARVGVKPSQILNIKNGKSWPERSD